jgi:hypothetical protein
VSVSTREGGTEALDGAGGDDFGAVFAPPSSARSPGLPRGEPRGGRREAEIDELRDTAPVDHDVARLHVAVHDAHLVDRPQPLEDLEDRGQHLAQAERPSLFDARGERLPRQELHHDEGAAILDAAVEHTDHVRMIHGRQRAGLAHEIVLALPERERVLAKHLDGDRALRHTMTPAVDGAEASP